MDTAIIYEHEATVTYVYVLILQNDKVKLEISFFFLSLVTVSKSLQVSNCEAYINVNDICRQTPPLAHKHTHVYVPETYSHV